jgi:hypothetical protein
MLSTDVVAAAARLSRQPDQDLFFQVIEGLSGIAADFPHLLGKQNGKSEILSRARNIVHGVRAFEFHDAAKSVMSAAGEVLHSRPHDDFNVYWIREGISSFLQKYETFLIGYNEDRAIDLVLNASSFRTQLEGYARALGSVAAALDDGASLDDPSIIQITLDGEFDFAAVKAAIDALCRSYELVCQLIGISASDEPLGLVRIESGSLELKAKGAKAAVSILRKFFVGLVKYAFVRNRIASTIDSTSALNELISARNSMSQVGLSTQNLDRDLEEIAPLISQQFLNLVRNANKIGIDGTFVSLVDDAQGLLSHDPRRLPHDTDEH